MARPKEIDDNPAKHNWKLLLYPDNPIHMFVCDEIERLYPDSFLCILHTNVDESGQIIQDGTGKPHYHFALDTIDDIRRASLCKRLGLVDPDSGLPDSRFLLPVYGRMRDWLPYLTHINTPDKKQYLESDLRGSPKMLQDYHVASLDVLGRELSVRECVQSCIEWVRSCSGRVSYTRFAEWLISTPYFRIRNDKLLWAIIDEHNQRVAMDEFQKIQDSYSNYAPAQLVQKVENDRYLILDGQIFSESDFEEVL